MAITHAIAYSITMGRNLETSKIIDELLRAMVAGGILATVIVAPNALQPLDKLLKPYLSKLDKNARSKEYKRLLRNLKKQGILAYATDDYEHGLKLTAAGKKRAQRAASAVRAIEAPEEWDSKWRIVFFDIPERLKTNRDSFSHKLKVIGFRQLQRSVWVHPFPCKNEVAALAAEQNVEKYVTYIETSYIDNAKALKERFKPLLP